MFRILDLAMRARRPVHVLSSFACRMGGNASFLRALVIGCVAIA